ncbi:MAG TPA: hypothetical protein V6C71_18355 [Coleofasciculaceae cyanobacterium]|jgi:hypothetical protein
MYDQNSAKSNRTERAFTSLVIKKHQQQLKTNLYINKIYYCVLAGLAFSSIYLIFNAPVNLPTSKLSLALLILWVCLFPSLSYLKNPQRPPIPFLPLIGLFYAITFSLPMFSSDDIYVFGVASLGEVSNFSLFLTLVGISSFIFFFYQSKSSLWKNVNPVKISNSYSINRLLFLTWLALTAHIAYEYVPLLHFIPSIGNILRPLGILCFGIFYLVWAEKKLPQIQALSIVGIFLPLEILAALTSGALAQIIHLILFVCCILWYKHQRISIILVAFIIAIYIFLNPIKAQYRALVWDGIYSQESLLTKTQLFIELAINHQSNKSASFATEDTEQQNIGRIAHIALFSKVIEDTPKNVPYWNGGSYLSLLTKFIPRVIWANKPKETIGNQFGQRYHLIAHLNTQTSVNLPWLVELYANFGAVGVLIGMSFFGVLLALIEQLFNSNKMNLIECVLGITVILNLVYQESNFSLMIGRVFILGIGLYFIAKFTLATKTYIR